MTHPWHADLPVHSILFCSVSRFRVFRTKLIRKAVFESTGKPPPPSFAPCERRGCMENKEFDLMEIESFGPPRIWHAQFSSDTGHYSPVKYNSVCSHSTCFFCALSLFFFFFVPLSSTTVPNGGLGLLCTVHHWAAGIACWLERRTRDRKVASSNPGRGNGTNFLLQS